MGEKEKQPYFPLIPARRMPPMPSPSCAPPHFLVKHWPCALLPLHVPSETEEMGDFRARQGLQGPALGPAWGPACCFYLSLPRNTIYTIQRSHPKSQATYILRVFTFWNFQMRNELFMYQHPSQLHGTNVNISPVTRCRRGPDTRFQSPEERLWSRTTSWLYLLWVKAFRSVQHLWNKRGRVGLFGHESSFPWS